MLTLRLGQLFQIPHLIVQAPSNFLAHSESFHSAFTEFKLLKFEATIKMSIHLIVIGAGLAGLSAAISTKVANPDHKVTILESVKELAEIGVCFLSTPSFPFSSIVSTAREFENLV